MEHDLDAFSLKGFSVYGKEWLAQTLDAETKAAHPGSGNEEAEQACSNEEAVTDLTAGSEIV